MAELALTKEERQRRSELAKQLHQEGKFGGPQPGSGRPRKPRAAELIADGVADEAQMFLDRLLTIARHGNDSNSRGAINDLLAIEEREQQRKEKRAERVEDMKRDELLLYVAEQFKELMDDGEIPYDIIGFATEIEDEGPSIAGEIAGTTEEK